MISRKAASIVMTSLSLMMLCDLIGMVFLVAGIFSAGTICVYLLATHNLGLYLLIRRVRNDMTDFENSTFLDDLENFEEEHDSEENS